MGEKIGRVFTYFAKIGVAGIELTDGALAVGDNIEIQGATTNIKQKVESMQIENSAVKKADKGASVGIKVNDRVRPNDAVYKI